MFGRFFLLSDAPNGCHDFQLLQLESIASTLPGQENHHG